MKSVIYRLCLIMAFMGCVCILVGTLPSFEWRVVFLLMLIVAGVWGIVLKPTGRIVTNNDITIYDPPMNDKQVLDFMRAKSIELHDLTHKS